MSTGILQRTLSSIAPTSDIIGVFLLLNFCAWLIVFVSRKWATSSKTTRSPTPDLEKPASRPGARGKVNRKFGGEYPFERNRTSADEDYPEWPPSDFKRPTAAPYPNWDVHTTKPIPYRPFRYGP